jgi:hypothetical protein
MLLGDLIAELEDEAVAAETIVRVGDLGLVAAMTSRAAEAGLPLGRYATWAVRHYADTAPDDEWVQLMGALGRADDPGAVCLQRAFAYVVAHCGQDGGHAA